VTQELCETDKDGKHVRLMDYKRNGTNEFKITTKKLQRVYMHYTYIRKHSSPSVDYMYLVAIKKERRSNPAYVMVLFNGITLEVSEVSKLHCDSCILRL